ncbi:PREDICTED: olfactory receptor 1019-like [Nanorana parkeri]|uniref:olfactory receptor 1019-like n=1 Tax=Nanorana parkeri TaxID=125878 RepID=UPI0008546650|nr:PREDICTED: olfactory receptor 1019-like [Nanorana parkeri]
MEFPKGSNNSVVIEFVLTGFSDRPDLKIFLFMIFLLVYLTSILGNAGIILIVFNNTLFHTPMYFFISNLSFIDLIYSSDIAPKMLAGLLCRQITISYIGCAMQLFFFCALGSTECILFAVMAFDRYVAICNPLSYNLVMQQKMCLQLVCEAFTAGLLHSLIETCLTFRLSFCVSNILHHFACDFPPLLSISCSDTSVNEIVMFILSSLLTMPSLVVILGSYISILLAILKITGTEGRKKAFSTCASHITAVTLLYTTVLYVYLSPKSSASRDNVNIATVFYTVVLPMLNPIIYSMRNQDIKNVLKATLLGKLGCNILCRA